MTDDFGNIWDRAQRIDGWLTEGQAQLLYDLARCVDASQTIVEIGSHHGRSTVILASAKRPETRLIAIDPYDDPRWGGGSPALEVFRANLFDCDVELRRAYGADVGRCWDEGSVGMLFVDGAHDFPTVNADLASWLPHVAYGGVVLVHDVFSSPGVTRAVLGHMLGSRTWGFLRSSRSLLAFHHQNQTTSDRLVSGGRIALGFPWMARNLAIKMALRRDWQWALPLLGQRDAAMPY